MNEADIRPDFLLNRYLELSSRDAEHFFDRVERQDLPCVACASEKHHKQFIKHGFEYALCEQCSTLYQTPRPPLSAFEAFYRNSDSSKFWAEEFFPAVAEARRDHIFRPRAEKLIGLCDEHDIFVENIVDVGAGYGIFLEEWRKKMPKTNFLAIEPSGSLATQCRAKDFIVAQDMVENVLEYKNFADLVVCFEVLEHVFDPVLFVKALAGLARNNGYIFISTLSVEGFDIQTLWESSNSISPPHHINFISIAGFRALFERAGLMVVDISTPGVLDVDIVKNYCKKNSDPYACGRFVYQLLQNDQYAKNFQEFLIKNLMSSHAWILAKKI